MPQISLVIPCHKRAEELSRLLRSILCQRAISFEVLVVANPPDEQLKKVVLSFNDSRLQLLEVDSSNVSLARNIGWQNTRAEKVYFIDDDCDLPDPFFLFRLYQLSRSYNGVLAGPYLSPPTAGSAGYCYNKMCNNWLERYADSVQPQFLAGNSLFPKNLISFRSLFHEGYTSGGEEGELSLQLFRLGIPVHYLSQMGVFHHFCGGWLRFFTNAWKHGQTRLPKTFRPKTSLTWPQLYWVYYLIVLISQLYNQTDRALIREHL